MTQINQTKLQELLAKARTLQHSQPEQQAPAQRSEQSSANTNTLQKTSELAVGMRAGGNSLVPNFDISKLNQALGKAQPPQEKLPKQETIPSRIESLGKDGTTKIYLNDKQAQAVTLALGGKSLIVIGAAGTGKTTTTREIINQLVSSGQAGTHSDGTHKHLRSGTPGIVCCAYTRRAVANIKQAMPEVMFDNTITIHKLLEYGPVWDEIEDPVTGKIKKSMHFEPFRNKGKPLSDSIHTVIIDESSMVSVELFKELQDALPHNPQYIFLGDIQQLPPVFGSAILGYKMLELPTIELIEVYRQALESPIIRLAHRILSGNPIKQEEFESLNVPSKLKLHPWKKKLHADAALMTAAKFFTAAIKAGQYNPLEDMILIPFNKSFGTDELNKFIAQFISDQRKEPTYEIIAGFKKHYLSIGDKVLYEKEDAFITSISMNGSYSGVKYQEPSVLLDRWGHYRKAEGELQHTEVSEKDLDDIDSMLDLMAGSAGEDRTMEASHVITLRMAHSDEEISISTASEINSLLLGYVLTVHKSQGSEWRKVFLVLHQSHNTMLQRELLYTACTRPKEELYIICEPDSFEKGILSQRIKGNSLKEKAEYFKGKQETLQRKLA